jgi:hypothetical protein
VTGPKRLNAKRPLGARPDFCLPAPSIFPHGEGRQRPRGAPARSRSPAGRGPSRPPQSDTYRWISALILERAGLQAREIPFGTRSEFLARSSVIVARAIASISRLRFLRQPAFDRRIAGLEGLNERLLLVIEIPADFRRLFHWTQSLTQKQRLILRRLLQHAKGLEGCSRRRRTAPSGTSFETSPDQVRGSRRLRTRESAFGSGSHPANNGPSDAGLGRRFLKRSGVLSR